ncbi:uncharacterized protein LOC113292865 [Papaver somniferum]|uniref:uncharacterized protein LOC113292865 n=1 Tax=Papaver somniferum TaxID=3469 RepID=UPI000E705F4F|nr:uncharacterized protein LOC113292865 [Papaver somniferum]
MDGNGKTSLEKVTRESANTIEKLQEDGESKPSTANIDEFALATSRNMNNIQVEASSVVTKKKETLSSELRGMNHPERFLNAAHDKKRILLILDLNGVLGSFGYRKMSELRPHCHEFVRFCVASFKKVVFWSSMTSANTTKEMKKIFPPDLDIQQIQIWNQAHCTDTKIPDPDSHKASKPWFLKVTYQINTRFSGDLDHALNTIMVDDSPLKTVINPRNTVVFPKTWHPGDAKDNTLSKDEAIRSFFYSLPYDGDIQDHVLTKQPKCFRQEEADSTIAMVWGNSYYATKLRNIEEQERTKAGSTIIGKTKSGSTTIGSS